MPDHGTDDVRFERRGRIGLAALSRPKALNSLTLDMCAALDARLARWADDPGVRAVVLRGEGGRAFCAGGDIRWLRGAAKRDPAAAADFFRTEYRLNTRLQEYAKPVIALMDGVTMGGGVGISAPARYRVATERTLWAMPECGIGLIPDVGASWHLNQLVPGVGLWLGLTGERLDGAGALGLGIATHLVPSDALDDLTEALVAAKLDGDADAAIRDALAAAGTSEGTPPDVPDAFAQADGLEALMEALERSEAGSAALRAILGGSPTSAALTHRLLTEAPAGFRDAIAREFRVAAHLIEGPDFHEGVRAQVIDKDRQPRWSPDGLDDVTDAMLDRYFEAPEGGDLDLGGV